jgi:hypothetical protein
MRLNIFIILFIGLSINNFHNWNFLAKNELGNLVPTTYSAQTTKDSVILWSASKKLNWNDFKGKADENSSYKAITTTLILTDVINYSDSLLTYKISCFFKKLDSWTKLKTSSLLKHEQIHFDIAEIAARRMRKRFLEHKSLKRDSINVMINSIMQKAVSERRLLNESYDTETNHSVNKEKQKEWEIKIANELKSLAQYANTQVTIKRVKK